MLSLQLPILQKALENIQKEIQEKHHEINLATSKVIELQNVIANGKAKARGLCIRYTTTSVHCYNYTYQLVVNILHIVYIIFTIII
jgi:hypothetical protein